MTTLAVPASDLAPRVHSRVVADHAVPTGREEEWRFTPLSRLRGLTSGEADFTAAVTVSWESSAGGEIAWVPMDDPRVGKAFSPADIVSAAAMASTDRALLITLAAEQQPIVRVTVECRGGVAAGHIVIDAEPFAEGTVILDHRGDGTYAGNVEVRVGNGARIRVVSMQRWDRDAVHLGEHHADLGRDSALTMLHVTLGGDVVRLKPTVSYRETGGDAEMLGLFFADAGQHLEHRVFVDHDTPHCRSSVLYKGALQGAQAHSVWVGDVLVRSQAVGVDTYEVNRNLILTDGARADSVPNLELETSDIVGAGHASATGRFDDEQLFYLQSRGIPEELARVLVVRGFFAEVLGRAQVPGLANEVMAEVDQRLGIEISGTGLDGDDEGVES